ncbi:MAG: SAM-dependent chlorinase/fluorinase [Bryobacterales bacterium]|nr:SAM-dependent chlorinase/fluorinase [Bryobacterales bacterium]
MTRSPVRPAGVLTLTTDFGTRDHYVGAMKGAVISVAPQVRVFDISHEIPSFDVAEGAFAIAQSFPHYPDGTVHVVVIDPGVGSARRPVAVAAGGHWFVAPDNGVLSLVLEAAGRFEAREVDLRHGLPRMSTTFHGRDLFAPVGARLAIGLPFDEIGPEATALVRMDPAAASDGCGRVLHVDGFGNLVTSFRASDLPEGASLALGDGTVSARARAYASMPAGRLFLIVGSSGYVEVSMNRGSAADALGVRAGEAVTLVADDSVSAGSRTQSVSEVE